MLLRWVIILLILLFPLSASAEKPLFSFENSLLLVFANHPLLRTFKEREEAIKRRAAQAARWENPEFNLTFEDVFGSGAFSGTRSSETTLEIEQRIPLFGQNRRRREAVLAETGVLEAAREEARLFLFRKTARAFTAALYAREKVKLYQELLSLSQKLLEVTRAKYEAGKIPETETVRAEIVVAETETRLANARLEEETAQRRLARLWGGETPRKVSGNLFKRIPIALNEIPKNHPRLKRLRAGMERLKKEMLRARAEALPEVAVSSGVRFYNESDERALVFGLRLPLPLINRNQDKIAALRREITATKLDLQTERIRLLRRMEEIKSALANTERQILTLEERLLPRARDIYRRNLEAYRLGKMEFLRVLDAQRTLFELRLSRIEAYRRYHELRAEALYLLARIERNFF